MEVKFILLIKKKNYFNPARFPLWGKGESEKAGTYFDAAYEKTLVSCRESAKILFNRSP
jgi:hypothetical protein